MNNVHIRCNYVLYFSFLLYCTTLQKDYFKENIEECGASEFKSLDAQEEIQIDESFDLATEQDNAVGK